MTLAQSPASDPEVRATGIGGSDLARILGLSRFGGPMDVWMEKRRLAVPLQETERMRWGKLLEDPIAQEYAVKSGRKVLRHAATIRVKGRPHLFAHIDRESVLRGTPRRVLECKNADTFMVSDFGEPGTDQVPMDYLIQLQHYLGVTGREQGDLAVLIGGNTHRVFTMARDDELLENAWAEADRMWSMVEQGVPPDVDGSDAWRQYATGRFEDRGIEIPMTDNIERLAYLYEAHKEAEQQSGADKKAATNELIVVLGEASRALGRGVKVTHSVFPKREIDWKAIAEAANVPAAVIEEFTKIRTEHRITVTIKEA